MPPQQAARSLTHATQHATGHRWHPWPPSPAEDTPTARLDSTGVVITSGHGSKGQVAGNLHRLSLGCGLPVAESSIFSISCLKGHSNTSPALSSRPYTDVHAQPGIQLPTHMHKQETSNTPWGRRPSPGHTQATLIPMTCALLPQSRSTAWHANVHLCMQPGQAAAKRQ